MYRSFPQSGGCDRVRSEDPRGYRSMCDHPVYQYPCGSLN